jgi:hypothetical protein
MLFVMLELFSVNKFCRFATSCMEEVRATNKVCKGVCRRYLSQSDRPWRPTTLTMFSTSNFNLVELVNTQVFW